MANMMTTTMNPEYNFIKMEESQLPQTYLSFSKPPNFLDLLATVATETLKNDKSLIHVKTQPLSRPLKSYSFSDVKKMSGSSLLRLFAIPDMDEMKKTYRFKCRLLPDECSNIVSSVGNETRAKNQMKSHLLTHVREKRKDLDQKLFYPCVASPKNEVKTTMNIGLNSVYWKEHSYSLLSAVGKPPLNNDHDDVPIHSDPEPLMDYSKFLGKYLYEDDSYMDVDEFVSELECVNPSRCLVPAVGSEVLCNSGSTEDSVSEKEKESATMAIILLQLKGSNTPIEDLSCSICLPKRKFTTYSSLLSHLKSHSGVKAFECQDCSAQFTRQHSLNYHRLIHDNQTRFTCEDCGRKFRHPSHYKEHRRRHTGELPFQCVDCLLRYKTRNTYKRHLRVNHGKILTSLGSVVRLNGPTDENEDAAGSLHSSPSRVKRAKPPSDGGDSSSSSSMTDEEDKAGGCAPPEEEPLSITLKFNSVTSSESKDEPRSKNPSSPVPNFVSDPPLGAITPKKKINPAMISNGVTISKYSDHLSSSNIENKNNVKSFKPSSKSAFKTPGDIYKRVRNNVEIRKLVCFDGSSSSSSSSTASFLSSTTPSKNTKRPQTPKVKILKESVETNNKTPAILAEIDGKRVLLIPKEEQPQPSPGPTGKLPKSKLEECLLYGVQRAKNSL